MKKQNRKVLTCPNCSSELDVDQLMLDQLSDSIRADVQQTLKQQQEELLKQEKEFKKLSLSIQKEKEEIDLLVNKKVKYELQAREQSLKETLRIQLEETSNAQILDLQEEISRKNNQIISLNKSQVDSEKIKRDLELQKSELVLRLEQEHTQKLLDAKQSIEEESKLREKEKEQVIQQLRVKLDELKYKIDHTTANHIAGTAQEIIIEDLLLENFISDEVIPVKVGSRGGDTIFKIRTQSGLECGSILIESKRVQKFQAEFITKAKSDCLLAKADVAVIIVSPNAMPKGFENQRYALIDNVWVVSRSENNILEICLMLRYGILKVFSVLQTQKNKDSKMEMLYSFLTSNEFYSTFRQILDGFRSLQEAHEAEKRTLLTHWKKQEKYLSAVLQNTISIYASIKGISGNDFPDIDMLEFPKAG